MNKIGIQDTENDPCCPKCGKPIGVCAQSGCNRGTVATFDVVEAAFPTRLRAIIDTPGAIDDAYRSDFVRAVEIIERLRSFEKRILAFRDGLREDSIDEDGTRYPYMLLGNDADVLEDLEKAING